MPLLFCACFALAAGLAPRDGLSRKGLRVAAAPRGGARDGAGRSPRANGLTDGVSAGQHFVARLRKTVFVPTMLVARGRFLPYDSVYYLRLWSTWMLADALTPFHFRKYSRLWLLDTGLCVAGFVASFIKALFVSRSLPMETNFWSGVCVWTNVVIVLRLYREVHHTAGWVGVVRNTVPLLQGGLFGCLFGYIFIRIIPSSSG